MSCFSYSSASELSFRTLPLSLKHKRYLNINVHHDKDKYWNLGMEAISGHVTSKITFEEVENKLFEFNLSLSRNIVTIVSNGESAMVIFGRCVDCEHQLCNANVVSCCL